MTQGSTTKPSRVLIYTDIKGYHLQVNFRIYDPADGKAKNDYFIDMLKEVLVWGLRPAYVTGDSWYSSIANLTTVKNNGLGFMFAVKRNRTVSVKKGDYQQVQSLDIPEEGKKVWLCTTLPDVTKKRAAPLRCLYTPCRSR